jgi:hypothetical protein
MRIVLGLTKFLNVSEHCCDCLDEHRVLFRSKYMSNKLLESDAFRRSNDVLTLHPMCRWTFGATHLFEQFSVRSHHENVQTSRSSRMSRQKTGRQQFCHIDSRMFVRCRSLFTLVYRVHLQIESSKHPKVMLPRHLM